MSRSIVDAITEIGHQRGLDVVAEWVDSERIVEILRSLGVDYGQGYATPRPGRVLYHRTPWERRQPRPLRLRAGARGKALPKRTSGNEPWRERGGRRVWNWGGAGN